MCLIIILQEQMFWEKKMMIVYQKELQVKHYIQILLLYLFFIIKAEFIELLLNSNSDFNQIVNKNSDAIAPSDEQNNQLTGLRFSHDVEKYQKNNYLTDVFPVDQQSVDGSNDSKTKKGIGFVQGIKNECQRKQQVLPKLLVSINITSISIQEAYENDSDRH